MKPTYWDHMRPNPLVPLHPPFKGLRFWFACFYYHFTHVESTWSAWFS